MSANLARQNNNHATGDRDGVQVGNQSTNLLLGPAAPMSQ